MAKKIIIDGKPIIYKSTKNTPSISTIKNAYAKIPDSKKIPVVFETKTQYLNEYIKNQEKKKNIDFTPSQEKAYKKTELRDMKNIVSRYTTKHNPYIDPRVVFFTDNKMPKEQFEKSVMHEYGHELWEKNPKIRRDWKAVNKTTSPTPYGRTDRQEDFAESFMLAKTGQLRDPARNRILQRDATAQNKKDLFAQFDVNHDGRVDDKDMNILRQRERKGLTRDTRAKNSVADAIDTDIPDAYLFTDEWKLYGGPKNYSPETHDRVNLNETIGLIIRRHKDNLLENSNTIPEINMSANSTLRQNVANIINSDTSRNRKYVKERGNKTYYEPQGREGASLPVYTASKRPSIPSGVYEAPTVDHPLPNNTPISNIPNIRSITNKFKRQGIVITPSMERDNTTPIGKPGHPGLIYDAAARINFAKQGMHVYNTDETPSKLGGLEVYDTTHYNTRTPYVNPNLVNIHLTNDDKLRTYPKPEQVKPAPKTILGSQTLYNYGKWLNFAQKAKADRERAEEQRQYEDAEQNRGVQQLQAINSKGLLSAPIKRQFSQAQLINFSPDLVNNFGVIRAGSTYTPYPIPQKKARIFQNYYEDDPDKEKKLLKDELI